MTTERRLFAWFKEDWLKHGIAELLMLNDEQIAEAADAINATDDETREALANLEECDLLESHGMSAKLSARGVMACEDANELTYALAEIDLA